MLVNSFSFFSKNNVLNNFLLFFAFMQNFYFVCIENKSVLRSILLLNNFTTYAKKI